MTPGKLYLIPTPIAETDDVYRCMPASNREAMQSLDYYIVEDLRSGRRFLSKAGIGRPIDSLELAELSEHTPPEAVEALLKPVLAGKSAGLLSEAGVPCVADPGAEAVAAAHRHGIEVVPLVGPSSLILALMASGLNGQSFAFDGYLPVKPAERTRRIRELEKRALGQGQTQLFIETPYRNDKLFEELLRTCGESTRLCVACDIGAPTRHIRTRTVGEWRKDPAGAPDLKKRPAIFLLGR